MNLSHDPLWPRAGDWPSESSGRAAVVLIGVPTHARSISPTTAHTTPAAVRRALRFYSPTLHTGDELPGNVIDLGDTPDPDTPQGRNAAQDFAAQAAQRAELVIALGGDNSLSVPVARGVWGEEISTAAGLITFDAHLDLREGWSNGSPVRELLEAGLEGGRTTQLGIADFVNSRTYLRRAAEAGIEIVTRETLEEQSPQETISRAVTVAGNAGGPIHVDVDVDVCDRSAVPGCPAAVPGGISAYLLRRLVRLVARDPRVRSIDIAEVDAGADAPDARTVRLAALCVLEAIAGHSERKPAPRY